MAAGCMASGPGVPADDGAGAPVHDVELNATLLSHIDLGAEHFVDFFELPDGQLAMRESGSRAHIGEQVDFSSLHARGVSGMYRSLVGDEAAPVPEGLTLLEARQAQRDPRLPAGEAATLAAPPEPTQAELASTGGARYINPSVDAQWWADNFCSWSQVDGSWCPTNVGWATSGWRQTMYYETVGMSASETAVATHWIDYWDGSIASWVRLGTTTMQPRWWHRWAFVSGTWYRSGVSGSLVHFSERFRKGIPSFWPVGTFPSDASYGFANDLQGLTHDANYWYITRTEQSLFGSPQYGVIARVPLGTSLGNEPSYRFRQPDAWTNLGYNHFGDLVHVNGLIYVGVEGGGRAAVGIFDTSLSYVGIAQLPGLSAAPILAYNPTNGLFYSTTDATNNRMLGYRVSINGNGTVSAVQVDNLWFNGAFSGSLAGAKFSNKGNLYIAVGYKGNNPHGFYGIDGYSGLIASFTDVPYGDSDEFEGLDIFDADADPRAPGVNGQIHIMQVSNDILSHDDFFLPHYRTGDVSAI